MPVDREFLHRGLNAVHILTRLVVQLDHGRQAGTAGSLIRRHDDALDRRDVSERLERDDHLDGGAIGVGDHAVVQLRVFGVDLGNHQRHVLVHAECA